MKVIGIGLNKTGTKTLKFCLEQWGLRHQSYDLDAFNLYRAGKTDELLKWMKDYDSFEDWPWPLFYKKIDETFPDAKFILTTRSSPDRWYKSLCKMAVRMGPFHDYEKHIYGYAMPQGHKQEHIDFYDQHNREVREYFASRPDKLLEICWERDDDSNKLADFLGKPPIPESTPNENQSFKVYSGDNLMLAQANRVWFQSKWKLIYFVKRVRRKLVRTFKRTDQNRQPLN